MRSLSKNVSLLANGIIVIFARGPRWLNRHAVSLASIESRELSPCISGLFSGVGVISPKRSEIPPKISKFLPNLRTQSFRQEHFPQDVLFFRPVNIQVISMYEILLK